MTGSRLLLVKENLIDCLTPITGSGPALFYYLGHIFVETLGGVTQSEQAFGFKFVIYDDALKEGWWVGGWDGSEDFENTEQVKRGDFSIKRIYNGGYSGFQIGNGGAPLPISDYSAVKVSIYGEQNVGNLRFSINALNEQELGVILQVEEGQWNDFEISLVIFLQKLLIILLVIDMICEIARCQKYIA